MCSSNKVCTVLMERHFKDNSKVNCFVVQGCSKVNSSKNYKFKYEMVEVVAVICSFSLKAGC